MKRYFKIICILVFILIVLVRANSDSLALLFSGFNQGSVPILHEVDHDNQEYKVVQTFYQQSPALVQLTRNRAGFWRIVQSDVSHTESLHWASLAWVADSGSYYHSSTHLRSTKAWHYAFCGDNAIKPISIDGLILPRNIAVNVTQHNNLFVIHVIAYEDQPSFSPSALYEYLLSRQYIDINS